MSMLLVGTRTGLLDLDTGHSLVDGHSVTALAPGPGAWHALLDRRVVIRLDDTEVTTVGDLPTDDGQSLAVLADGSPPSASARPEGPHPSPSEHAARVKRDGVSGGYRRLTDA